MGVNAAYQAWDIADSIPLNLAVSKAESVLSHVNSALYTYQNEAANRLTYYNPKKESL